MSLTIQQVIDTIYQSLNITEMPVPFPETVDTFKSGDPSQVVSGIVTTFISTRQVIEKAIELNANLIITHEPTYFNHLDQTEWLTDDPVYQAKRRLLEEHDIVVWRFHDHWHAHWPDGISTGFSKTLGWEAYQDSPEGFTYTLPARSLLELAHDLKNKLGLPTVRIVGRPEMPCRKVCAFLGASPGEAQIEALARSNVDVLIVGETVEWQTCEYVRDAAAGGLERALVILGHEKSEEPGMAYLVEWLSPKLPGIPITHVPAGDPLLFV